MSARETIKKAAEQLTGLGRPPRSQLKLLLRSRKPQQRRFKDDGLIPNHPHWPLVLYRSALRLPGEFDPAAVVEDIFAANGWGDMWRNGIYDYAHYHSRIHEVLGVARGWAKVRVGGATGRTITLKAGDVAILPAGTSHQSLSASRDFLVVGAYPPIGTYDECTSSTHRARSLKSIPKVPRPARDPLYGARGPLRSVWKRPL